MKWNVPQFVEWEFLRVKAGVRIALVCLMAIPLFMFGALLWRDGSFAGRWDFMPEFDVRPMECKGGAFVLQYCNFRFSDRTGGMQTKIEYLAVGVDWNGIVPDVVRGAPGHFSTSMAVTGPGMVARFAAFLILVLLGLVIENFVLQRYLSFLVSHMPVAEPVVRQSKDTVMLSRDRRDHY